MPANIVLFFLWIGVTAYVLLGGADFGAGFWDLLAGSAHRGARQRRRIEQSIGPVWEANHVWLIFALVVVWTGFPTVFAAIGSTLYIPLMAAAFGIILRGSAFAFRKTVTELWQQRIFGAAFALSSVVTPFFLGSVAGAIASGRVPLGTARGGVITSWFNPTSALGGVLAVEVCAYLAAVYLTADSRRVGEVDLVDIFRRRAMVMGALAGMTALAGIAVLHNDAPRLFAGLTGRGQPLVAATAVAGIVSLVLLWRRRLLAVRVTAALAVVFVLWGWAVAQYPDVLPGAATVDSAAAPHDVLVALVWVLSIGTALLLPALFLLYRLSQAPRPLQEPAADEVDGARQGPAV
jgi:cytochrome bd ubiquinol oxidase subunit II